LEQEVETEFRDFVSKPKSTYLTLPSNTKWLSWFTIEVQSRSGSGCPFQYIADTVKRAQRLKQPTISVDPKKKELVGEFKNGGRAWRPKGAPDHGSRPWNSRLECRWVALPRQERACPIHSIQSAHA
jgi:hypothetical protein